MARVIFTPHLRFAAAPRVVAGRTLREVLEAALAPHERGYVLDDQGAVRKHVAVFIDGEQCLDRRSLSDPVAENGEVHVLQALSGG